MTAETAQARFDAQYITSSEIAARLAMSRFGIMSARKRGELPGAVIINEGQIIVWDRNQIEPYLVALAARRAKRAERYAAVHQGAHA